MSFVLVPPDLLLKIFHQLPFKDRVLLGGVNRSFKDASTESINRMKSLVVTDDLVPYSMWIQTLSSLFESCSQTLESIKINNGSMNKWMLNALTEFVYPKLDRLTISITTANDEVARKLISRNRNVRSIILHLNGEFQWPEDIVLDKLERLEIRSSDDSRGNINLTPTLRPVIGKVPNLKHFSIDGISTNRAKFELPVQEFSQLLATTPWIQELQLSGRCGTSNNGNFVAALPSWRLPNLTSLVIDFYIPSFILHGSSSIYTSILHGFPTSFPRLESFKSERINIIGGQAVVALSQLEHLRELRLPHLVRDKEKFIEMVSVLPLISVLEICYVPDAALFDDQAIQALSQLQYLRELHLSSVKSTKDQIIDLLTNIPSLAILEIFNIPDARSPVKLIDFLKSIVALFQRNLEIRLKGMTFREYDMELEQMKAILEEMKNNGGPVVDMERYQIRSIRYSP